MLQLDWSRPKEYLAAISEHLSRVGPPDLVVAWIHVDQVAFELVSRLAAVESPCSFFHLLGSMRGDLRVMAERLREVIPAGRQLTYHQVLLGSVQQRSGTRWLPHEEISQGVLRAIGRRAPVFVVGEVS